MRSCPLRLPRGARFGAIPSVERLLRAPGAAPLLVRWRRERVVEIVRLVLRDAPPCAGAGGALPDDEALLARVGGPARRRGRAPAAARRERHRRRAAHQPRPRAAGRSGGRGAGRWRRAGPSTSSSTWSPAGAVNRDALLADDLCALTGAEAALVVNNNAAAVLLAIAALAGGREVVVSRGELVEIGGSFRMPEVMALGGARLREVGTTNRTHADDYRRAVGPETGLLVKAHTSNYRIVGFTASVELAELAAIARAAGVPVLEDLGSGALSISRRSACRASRWCASASRRAPIWSRFSGDKLLGGPQAGIVVGRPT